MRFSKRMERSVWISLEIEANVRRTKIFLAIILMSNLKPSPAANRSISVKTISSLCQSSSGEAHSVFIILVLFALLFLFSISVFTRFPKRDQKRAILKINLSGL